MDLTYSSAWSLGKLAAISDSPFNAALLKFRSLVWTLAASNTRMVTNGISPTATVIANTASAIAGAHVQTTAFSGVISPLNPTSKATVAGPLTSATVAPIFAKAIQLDVDRYASTVDGKISSSRRCWLIHIHHYICTVQFYRSKVCSCQDGVWRLQ